MRNCLKRQVKKDLKTKIEYCMIIHPPSQVPTVKAQCSKNHKFKMSITNLKYLIDFTKTNTLNQGY